MEQTITFLLDLLVGNSHGVTMAWGALIGAAVGLGSSIIGSKASSDAAKASRDAQLKAIEEQKAELQKQKEQNQAWYNRRYNEDATNRADAQVAIRRTNDAIKKRTQAALGKKNVIGGTDASMATVQQQNAEAMGNALGDIVAKSEARKGNIEQQYRQTDSQLNSNNNQLTSQEGLVNANYEAARSQNTANAVTGALKAVGSGVGALADAGIGSGKSSASGSANSGISTPQLDELTGTRSASDYSNDILKYYSDKKDPWQQTT